MPNGQRPGPVFIVLAEATQRAEGDRLTLALSFRSKPVQVADNREKIEVPPDSDLAVLHLERASASDDELALRRGYWEIALNFHNGKRILRSSPECVVWEDAAIQLLSQAPVGNSDGGRIATWTYALDPTQTPKIVTLIPPTGSRVMRGIYELHRDPTVDGFSRGRPPAEGVCLGAGFRRRALPFHA